MTTIKTDRDVLTLTNTVTAGEYVLSIRLHSIIGYRFDPQQGDFWILTEYGSHVIRWLSLSDVAELRAVLDRFLLRRRT